MGGVSVEIRSLVADKMDLIMKWLRFFECDLGLIGKTVKVGKC